MASITPETELVEAVIVKAAPPLVPVSVTGQVAESSEMLEKVPVASECALAVAVTSNSSCPRVASALLVALTVVEDEVATGVVQVSASATVSAAVRRAAYRLLMLW
jgi:hypothetical protein